jgi:hypothetical protein
MTRPNTYDVLASVLVTAAILVAAYSAGLLARSAHVRSRLPALEAGEPNESAAEGSVEGDRRQPAPGSGSNATDEPEDSDANEPSGEADESSTDPNESVADSNEVSGERQRALQSEVDVRQAVTGAVPGVNVPGEQIGTGQAPVRARPSRRSRTDLD